MKSNNHKIMPVILRPRRDSRAPSDDGGLAALGRAMLGGEPCGSRSVRRLPARSPGRAPAGAPLCPDQDRGTRRPGRVRGAPGFGHARGGPAPARAGGVGYSDSDGDGVSRQGRTAADPVAHHLRDAPRASPTMMRVMASQPDKARIRTTTRGSSTASLTCPETPRSWSQARPGRPRRAATPASRPRKRVRSLSTGRWCPPTTVTTPLPDHQQQGQPVMPWPVACKPSPGLIKKVMGRPTGDRRPGPDRFDTGAGDSVTDSSN